MIKLESTGNKPIRNNHSTTMNTTPRKLKTITATALAALLFTASFVGCQVSYVRPSSGDMVGSITVYQGFSRSAVGESNDVAAASTKTSAVLTAAISPELSAEFNPSVSGNSAAISPEFSSEINPELDTEISPKLELSDLSDVTYDGAEQDEFGAEGVEVEEAEVMETP